MEGPFSIAADFSVRTGKTTAGNDVVNLWSQEHTYVPASGSLGAPDQSPSFEYVQVGQPQQYFRVLGAATRPEPLRRPQASAASYPGVRPVDVGVSREMANLPVSAEKAQRSHRTWILFLSPASIGRRHAAEVDESRAVLLDWLRKRRPDEPIETVETHISVLAFQGDRAYTLKKAVAFRSSICRRASGGSRTANAKSR